jgi:hypothetical protein
MFITPNLRKILQYFHKLDIIVHMGVVQLVEILSLYITIYHFI